MHTDQTGRIVATTLHTQQQNLIVIGTYWPSGSSSDALLTRCSMQETVKGLLSDNPDCIPIILGDMNATFTDSDRSGFRAYEADKMYRAFLQEIALQPIPEYNLFSCAPQPMRPWTHLQSTATTTYAGNTLYSVGRIDDIILPQKLAENCPSAYTCNLGYQSDHIPLIVSIHTNTLNICIPRPQPACTNLHPMKR